MFSFISIRSPFVKENRRYQDFATPILSWRCCSYLEYSGPHQILTLYWCNDFLWRAACLWVCYTFSAISSGHSACQNYKILNSGCRHVNTQHGNGGCGMKCDSNTYSGIVISADWRGPSWYRYLLKVKSPPLNGNSCKTFMSYFWLLLHLATDAKYQRSF